MQKEHIIGTVTERNKIYNIEIETEIDKENTLHISGSIQRNRHDWLSGGQCQDTIKEYMIQDAIKYAEDWNKDKLFKLLEVWDKHHLNDMHPECEHQETDGTLEEARQEVAIYGYKLKPEISALQSTIKEKAEERLLKDRHTSITKEEQEILKLEYSLRTLESTPPVHYEATNDSYWGNKTEKRGHISFKDFPTIGILSRPCKTCGYKYGTAWKKRELPEEVKTFINNL